MGKPSGAAGTVACQPDREPGRGRSGSNGTNVPDFRGQMSCAFRPGAGLECRRTAPGAEARTARAPSAAPSGRNRLTAAGDEAGGGEDEMCVADLEAIVDRAVVDAHFRRVASRWSESLHGDYSLSTDEVDALRASDFEALVKLGLDETRARLVVTLS